MAEFHRISQGAAVQYGDPDRVLVMASSMAASRKDSFDYIDYARSLPYTILFLRDDNGDVGYHKGVAGLTDSIESTVEFLDYFINKIGPGRVSFHGASFGGYAANLFGHLLGCDDIHVIGAPSYILPELRDKYGGGERLEGAMLACHQPYLERGEAPRFMDLREVILANPGKVGVTRLHYVTTDLTDRLQAEHLRGLPRVQLFPEPEGRHSFQPLVMVRSGRLTADFEKSVDELLAETAETAT